MKIVGVNVMVPLVRALASMPPVPSVKVLPPKVNELAPLLKVSLLTDRLVMLLVKVRPDNPAAPNTSESPLAGGVLPPDRGPVGGRVPVRVGVADPGIRPGGQDGEG